MSSAAFCTWEITNAAMCGSHRVPLLRDRRVSAVWYVASMARHTKWMLRDDRIRRRPYRVLCTGSLLTSEIKRRRARLVLGWGTAREDLMVLSAFFYILCTHKHFVLEVGALHGGRSRISEWCFITTYKIRHSDESRVASCVPTRPPISAKLPNFFQFLPFPIRYPSLHNFKYAQH
jgi:hypothetical protein